MRSSTSCAPASHWGQRSVLRCAAPVASETPEGCQSSQEYLHSLPLEHFMEATAQGRQRAISLASLALVHGRRSDVHIFQ